MKIKRELSPGPVPLGTNGSDGADVKRVKVERDDKVKKEEDDKVKIKMEIKMEMRKEKGIKLEATEGNQAIEGMKAEEKVKLEVSTPTNSSGRAPNPLARHQNALEITTTPNRGTTNSGSTSTTTIAPVGPQVGTTAASATGATSSSISTARNNGADAMDIRVPNVTTPITSCAPPGISTMINHGSTGPGITSSTPFVPTCSQHDNRAFLAQRKREMAEATAAFKARSTTTSAPASTSTTTSPTTMAAVETTVAAPDTFSSTTENAANTRATATKKTRQKKQPLTEARILLGTSKRKCLRTRHKRARQDADMVKTLTPLRQYEISRLLQLGTDEARAAAEVMQRLDKKREDLLKKYENTSFKERMKMMTEDERIIHEEYRDEYFMQKSRSHFANKMGPNAKHNSPMNNQPSNRATQEQQKKVRGAKSQTTTGTEDRALDGRPATGQTKKERKEEAKARKREAAERKKAIRKEKKVQSRNNTASKETLQERLAREAENKRLFREDRMGVALGLSHRIHDKRLEHTQRDGPYCLRSLGPPEQGELDELEYIEDVASGIAYAAWRMKDDPEVFEEYEEAERNLSPPPSPTTSNKMWNKILFNSRRLENIDDIYYDFWAKETYRRPERTFNSPTEQQTTDEQNGQDPPQPEVERINAPDDDGDYEQPTAPLSDKHPVDIISSDDSDTGEMDQTWGSLNNQTITIDDTSDEDCENNKGSVERPRNGLLEHISSDESDDDGMDEAWGFHNNQTITIDTSDDDDDYFEEPVSCTATPTVHEMNKAVKKSEVENMSDVPIEAAASGPPSATRALKSQSSRSASRKEKTERPKGERLKLEIEKKSESPEPAILQPTSPGKDSESVKIEKKSESPESDDMPIRPFRRNARAVTMESKTDTDPARTNFSRRTASGIKAEKTGISDLQFGPRNTTRWLVKKEEPRAPEPQVVRGRKQVKKESGDSDIESTLRKEVKTLRREESHPSKPVKRGRKRRIKNEPDDGSDSEPVSRNARRMVMNESDEDFVFTIDSEDDEDLAEVKQLLNKPRSLRSRGIRSDAEHIFLK
ncbi:hypothetical protein BJ508DRAFT_410070 [Ascobolus immersus RN42]|uniref:Uncharacterized protein n=1 Tax=Ascobolus immersus RN42 TaxID=1160509 RepID=A0A3N4IR53_ASCIM|nr:hypothetical protein BJ508DRAFT_410070 [Ascobolus immersus RN42]